eukprot:m.75550 g.75550  ORF g.75550 m.75550 type:complete len:501 (+) comp16176_c0_seq1:50-1552(+)
MHMLCIHNSGFPPAMLKAIMTRHSLSTLVIMASIGFVVSTHARVGDLVVSLPGWNASLPSQHYSGFLDVGSDAKVHYWLMESESNPSTAPLVLWFNGGPPCSALVGAFTELGPFRTSASGDLTMNPARWNQNANLLFIETPLGVGFSFNTTSNTSADAYAADDTTTAALNLAALKSFLRAFPAYSDRALWVAGESYAGIYVPMLALAILRSNEQLDESSNERAISLRGILVGNGAIATGDWYEGWLTGLRTANLYAHGLFSPALEAEIQKVCTNYTKGVISDACQKLLDTVTAQTGNLNQYDFRETCIPQPDSAGMQSHRYSLHRGAQHPLMTSSRQNRAVVHTEDPCDLGGADLSAWMNQASVQRAIHVDNAIPNGARGLWTDCGASFGRPVAYTRVPQDERVDVYPHLIGAISVLIYNGDQDNCIPYTQDQSWTAGMNVKEVGAWRPWMVEQQVGGYVVEYDKNFTFTTIKGAGHLCPRYQPARSLAMFERFIRGQQL